MKPNTRQHSHPDPQRRRLLTLLAASGIGSATSGLWYGKQRQQPQPYERWLSAQGKDNSHYGLASISPQQHQALNIPSGFRGHAICQHPQQPHIVVMSARRPGLTGLEVNLLTGQSRTFHSPANHHMQGHSWFSADGLWLFTTESNYHSGDGRITVRDSSTLQLVDNFPSHGIGPHEIRLMPDGKTLVVANGGLLTHPDSGRSVLNPDTMRSTLSYIDSHNGRLISEHRVPDNKASIRHFDIADDGSVAFGMQVQRQAMSDNHLVPLAAIHKPGQEIQLLHAPETLTLALHDYMGSVAIDSQHRIAAFTSPRGDLAMFWHLDDGSLQAYHAFHDVCGLALNNSGSHFVLSNSAGKIRQISTATLIEDKTLRMEFPAMAWDNHMMAINLLG